MNLKLKGENVMGKLYHGTTFENYKSILEIGFKPQNESWGCSDNQFMYFYNPENFLKHEECDDMENAKDMSIIRAGENARITGALQKSISEKVIILEIEIDDEFIENDGSCENMELASQVDIDNLDTGMITKLYSVDFLPNLSLLYLVGVSNNDYFNNTLSYMENTILQSFSGINVPEEISFVSEYEPIKLNTVKAGV